MVAVVSNQRFEQELENFGGEMLRAGARLSLTSQELQHLSQRVLQLEEMADTVSCGPVDFPLEKVDHVMSWTALMLLLGGGVASFLGAYILRPVLGLFFSPAAAAFFALIGFPLFELFIFKRNEETDLRLRLLSSSLSQGLLVGFALSDLHLSAQPLMCLTPFVVGRLFTSSFIQRQRGDPRRMTLACAGMAFGVNVALGIATGLLTPPYVVLSLLYVAFTASVLLNMMKSSRRLDETAHFHLYHVVHFTGILLLKMLIFDLFGYTSAQLEKSTIIR